MILTNSPSLAESARSTKRRHRAEPPDQRILQAEGVFAIALKSGEPLTVDTLL